MVHRFCQQGDAGHKAKRLDKIVKDKTAMQLVVSNSPVIKLCQFLFDDGSIQFFYGHGGLTSTCLIVGIS
jgi:hypothetical protein